MKLTSSIVVAAVLGLSGCKRPAAPAFSFDKCDGSVGFQEISSPVTCATTKSKSVNTVIGVVIKGSDLVAAMTNYEVGCKLIAKGGTTNKNGDVVTVPIADKLKSLTLGQILGTEPIDVDTTLTVTSPRYADTSVKVPAISAGRAFYNAETAEQVLVKNKLGLGATPPAKHNIFVASWLFPTPVMGDAKSLADIDWVALPVPKETKEADVCQYEGLNYKTKVDVVTVKLVDRRTGAVLDTKDFDAPGTCPGAISSSTQVWFEFSNPESWSAVKQWLTEKQAG